MFTNNILIYICDPRCPELNSYWYSYNISLANNSHIHIQSSKNYSLHSDQTSSNFESRWSWIEWWSGDRWHMTCDSWYMTFNWWHATVDSFLCSFSPSFPSSSLIILYWWYYLHTSKYLLFSVSRFFLKVYCNRKF